MSKVTSLSLANMGKKGIFLACLSLAVLIVVGGYVIFRIQSGDTKIEPAEFNSESLTYKFDKDSCKKDLKELSQYTTDDPIENSAIILNYRGDCYEALGQYDKALDQYKQIPPICSRLDDLRQRRCLDVASEAIRRVSTEKSIDALPLDGEAENSEADAASEGAR